MLIALSLTSCGAGDAVAPYSEPPPRCPEADDYLAPLYSIVDQGGVNALASTMRTLPEPVRRDVVDAILRLLTAFEEGSISALSQLPADEDSNLQITLGKVLRWLVRDSPSAPNPKLFGVVRTIFATCEGAPIFELLTETLEDPDLVTGLVDTLASSGLGESLASLDFEGTNGRDATRYLVRNLLVSASSSAFDVASIVGLLGLLVDLDAPPYDRLTAGLLRLLDADGLARLQTFLVCVRASDPELELGGFLYDILTSGLLSDLTVPGAVEPGGLLAAPTLRVASEALDFLARDAITRRDLLPVLLLFLSDTTAPPVMSDLATLFEAEAFSGVVDLVVNLTTGACRFGTTP